MAGRERVERRLDGGRAQPGRGARATVSATLVGHGGTPSVGGTTGGCGARWLRDHPSVRSCPGWRATACAGAARRRGSRHRGGRCPAARARVAPGGLDVGVRRLPEPRGVDEHPAAGAGVVLTSRGLGRLGPGAGVGLAGGDRGPGGGQAAGAARRPRGPRAPTRRWPGSRPRASPVRRRTPRTRSSQEWKTVRGVGALDVLEEGAVGRAGGVVEGEEDDPAPGAHRRGLGGDLDPGDQHLAAAAGGEQVADAGHPERVEQRGVEVDDVRGRVEPEHVELGADPLRAGHLGQPGARGRAAAGRRGRG